MLKHTNIQIAFKTTNTVQYLTLPTTHQNTTVQEKSAIYKLTCNTCKLTYIGQTSRSLQQRYKEHIRYIKHPQHTIYKLTCNTCKLTYILQTTIITCISVIPHLRSTFQLQVFMEI